MGEKVIKKILTKLTKYSLLSSTPLFIVFNICLYFFIKYFLPDYLSSSEYIPVFMIYVFYSDFICFFSAYFLFKRKIEIYSLCKHNSFNV